jgi:shikimate 5-dehydrogenase
MTRAGVMGWPVEHSRSPVLHGFWLKHYGIAGDYVKLPVPPEGLRAALVVNTTSLGMHGAPPLELGLDALDPAAVVNDIVYVPLETPLLAAARRHGSSVVDGLGMLLHQARPAFAAWFGVMPEVTQDLRRTIEATLQP